MADLAFSRRSQLASVVVLLLLNCVTDHYKSEALVLEEEFTGKVVQDLKVDLQADEVWAVYRNPNFEKILFDIARWYYEAVDYVTGRGGVGSIVNITQSEVYGSRNWLVKVVEINDETKTRVLRHLKGEHFDSGFTSFETRYTVIKSKNSSCIIRETTSFKIKQKSLSNATLVKLDWMIADAVSLNIGQKKPIGEGVLNEKISGEVGTEMKVNLPAKDVWDVFRSKDFGHLIRKLRPDYFERVDYVSGDGGVGTLLNFTFTPEFGSIYRLEKIMEIDDKTMTRRQRHVRGYALTHSETAYTVIPKARSSCVISEVRPFKAEFRERDYASAIIQPSWTTAITIANYVKKFKGSRIF